MNAHPLIPGSTENEYWRICFANLRVHAAIQNILYTHETEIFLEELR